MSGLDDRAEPVAALANGVVDFLQHWREAFLPEHGEYRGGDPGMDPLGVMGPVDHASSCLCSRLACFEQAGQGTYDSDVSLKIIRQCVAELWASRGRIWTGDVLGQFAIDGDGRVACVSECDRPEIDAARHLKILETHAARLLEKLPAPAISMTGVLRRESSDEERDRFCYEERVKGRPWKPILQEVKAKWPGDEFHSGTAAKKAANRHARRLGLAGV